MTQQPVPERDAALENAWANIMFDRWDQMAWFVKLANTAMATLHPGDILNLQGQCEAIRKVPISFHPIPSDRKRYPFHGGWVASASPTLRDLQNIHDAIAPRLNDLANGVDVSFGPIEIAHTIRFQKSNEAEQQAGYPPYRISPSSFLRGSHAWPDEFVLRAALLLETYVDSIRRCPHCTKVFLQLRRNANYCGPACYSVAGMRRVREKQRAQKALKLTLKTHRKGVRR